MTEEVGRLQVMEDAWKTLECRTEKTLAAIARGNYDCSRATGEATRDKCST